VVAEELLTIYSTTTIPKLLTEQQSHWHFTIQMNSLSEVFFFAKEFKRVVDTSLLFSCASLQLICSRMRMAAKFRQQTSRKITRKAWLELRFSSQRMYRKTRRYLDIALLPYYLTTRTTPISCKNLQID
jgi:hypothetical protein